MAKKKAFIIRKKANMIIEILDGVERDCLTCVRCPRIITVLKPEPKLHWSEALKLRMAQQKRAKESGQVIVTHTLKLDKKEGKLFKTPTKCIQCKKSGSLKHWEQNLNMNSVRAKGRRFA